MTVKAKRTKKQFFEIFRKVKNNKLQNLTTLRFSPKFDAKIRLHSATLQLLTRKTTIIARRLTPLVGWHASKHEILSPQILNI